MDTSFIIEGFYQNFGPPGETMVLNHLRSEKGKKMNGRRVLILGADPPKDNRRIHVRLLDPNTKQPTGKTLQIKPKNLVDESNYCSLPPQPTLKEDEAIKFLKKAQRNSLSQGLGNNLKPGDARDPYRRIQLVDRHFPDLPQKEECMDLMVGDDMNDFEKIKSLVQPACVGDGYVDFTRFGEGIVANGQEECTICQTGIKGDLIRLPCNHRFHVQCVKPWLVENQTCPSCRTELPNPWKTYLFKVSNDQIQKRFDEWFLSGMCERCQAVNLEDNPIVAAMTQTGDRVTMPLSVAREHGYTDVQRVQGQSSDKVIMGPAF